MEAKWEHVYPSRGVAIGTIWVHPQSSPCRQICRRHLASRQIYIRPLVLVDVGMRQKFVLSEDWFERSLLCCQIGVATPQKISLIYALVPKSSHAITASCNFSTAWKSGNIFWHNEEHFFIRHSSEYETPDSMRKLNWNIEPDAVHMIGCV